MQVTRGRGRPRRKAKGQEELIYAAAFLAIAALSIMLFYALYSRGTSFELCRTVQLVAERPGSALVVTTYARANCGPTGCQLSCGLFIPAQQLLCLDNPPVAERCLKPVVGGLPGTVLVGSTVDGRIYIRPWR